MAQKTKGGGPDSEFIHRVLIVFAIGALLFLAWQLRSVLILLFGAVVVATIFRSIADPIRNVTRIPEGLTVAIAVLIVGLVMAGVGWAFGSQLSQQWQTLAESLPSAWNSFVQRLEGLGVPGELLSWDAMSPSDGRGIIASAAGLVMSLGGGVGTFLLVLFGGIFLAAQPRFYKTGAIKLVPPARREVVADAMDKSENALRLWLKAQLVSMTVIGTLTGLGLWLVGVPSPIVLGLIAGILEFIPFAGPILAAIPGILLGMSHSMELGLWALGVYILVQNAEAYLIYPLVQQWAVHIPPAVLLFSLMGFGLMFGTLGVIFAAPMTVVAYVLVKRLYVVEALDTPTEIPGDDKD